MIIDKEGRKLRLVKGNSGHKLIIGKSGQGKTYFLCRLLEENCQEGKRTLILDFSGSYSEKELEEKNFQYMEKIQRYMLAEQEVGWRYVAKNQEKFEADLLDTVCEALQLRSYFQKKLLQTAIRTLISRDEAFSLPLLMREVEHMLENERKDKNATDNRENLGRLLTRLSPYAQIENLKVTWERGREEPMPITIIDLLGFPDGQRKFLTELFMGLLKREIYQEKESNRFDTILLDEMHFLSIKAGSPLATMMQEGRKKKVELVLSTQFTSHYGNGELCAFGQGDTLIVFQPASEERKKMAQAISVDNALKWEKILHTLRRGEAVLKGSYRIEGRGKVLSTPIVISIS